MKIRKPYPARIQYESGMRFNNFIILERYKSIISHKGRSYTTWKCKCDCGKEFIGRTKEIQKGLKSCGCLSKSNRFKKVSAKQAILSLKISHYKNSAKRRNFPFELDKEFFFKLITSNCHYCGSEPFIKNNKGHHSMLLNGIDRVENNYGYVNCNVVSCCKFCNAAKRDSTVEEFEKWIQNLINYRK